MYPAPQGLAFIGLGGAHIATREFYTQEEWRQIKPETFVAAYRDNKYVCAYTLDATTTFVLIIDKGEFASVTLANFPVQSLFTDPLNGKLYVGQDDQIYEWDAASGTTSLFDWMSKEFVLPTPANFAAAKVDADFVNTPEEEAASLAAYNAIAAANAAMIAAGTTFQGRNAPYRNRYERNGDALEGLPALMLESLSFQLWIDGVHKFTKQVTTSKSFRLPAGYKSDRVAVRMSGNVRVSKIAVAESMDALKVV